MGCERKRKHSRSASVADNLVDEFSERFRERENFAEIIGREIGASAVRRGAFAANLNYADDFFAGKNRRADNFLNQFAAGAFHFYAFENCGVAHFCEIVDNFGPAFARGLGGDRGSAGKRNEADLFQRFWHEKVKMAPTLRDAEQRDFAGFNANVMRDSFGKAGERDFRGGSGVRFERCGESIQFRSEAGADSRHNVVFNFGPFCQPGGEGLGGYDVCVFNLFKPEPAFRATNFASARAREANRCACKHFFNCLY